MCEYSERRKMAERKEFLTEQVITYLGNKRSLLSFIDNAVQLVCSEMNKDKLDVFDVFSGSGIVSRYLKQYSHNLYVNDLEDYCRTINTCYLTNEDDIDMTELKKWFDILDYRLNNFPLLKDGFIARLYAPRDDENIKWGERVFYTTRNAQYLDTARTYLNEVPEPYKTLLLAPLLYEASTKNNTSGVFKGFYKNSDTNLGQYGGNGQDALKRILANIELKLPVLSQNSCNVHILQGDSNLVCEEVSYVDLAYLDPPYNQHPYSSNYFMLNLINNYIEPNEISKVAGIPTGWNQSAYNKRSQALSSLETLCSKLKCSYILVSYNSEGFIDYDSMLEMLQRFGEVCVFDKKYNVFRGCRNLKKRDYYVKEYLFLLKKHRGG